MKQYLILDGAILEHKLEQALSLHEQHRSLYRGQTVPEIEAVGPYLFPYPHTDAFNSWFIGNGLRNNWGILVNAAVSLDEIENHFRQFLMVKTEEGQELYFRFYDPRVLRIFLPTCDAAQLREMFGAVHSFVCHDADDSFLFQYRVILEQFETIGRIFAILLGNVSRCSGHTGGFVLRTLQNDHNSVSFLLLSHDCLGFAMIT